MIKKIVFVILTIVLVSNVLYAQDDYMDKIALQSCECLDKVPDSLDNEKFNVQLGLCMIEAARPYEKKLKKDHQIDFKKIDEQAEQLGTLIGMRMATVCPEKLMLIVNRNDKKEEVTTTSNTCGGQVMSISDDKFVEFSIREESGKISKFYWLTFVESELNLPNEFKITLNKFVKIVYHTEEFFDPRIGEYRVFNIIEKLDLIKK